MATRFSGEEEEKQLSKGVIFYDSVYGNTEKIAKALAQGMKRSNLEIKCVPVKDAEKRKLSDCDVIAVGGPTHRAGMSKPMKAFLEGLSDEDVDGARGFCFDTRIRSRFNRFDLNGAAKRIERRMKRLGVRMLRRRASAIVEGREGPLEDGALETFEAIGRELATQLHRTQGNVDRRPC